MTNWFEFLSSCRTLLIIRSNQTCLNLHNTKRLLGKRKFCETRRRRLEASHRVLILHTHTYTAAASQRERGVSSHSSRSCLEKQLKIAAWVFLTWFVYERESSLYCLSLVRRSSAAAGCSARNPLPNSLTKLASAEYRDKNFFTSKFRWIDGYSNGAGRKWIRKRRCREGAISSSGDAVCW